VTSLPGPRFASATVVEDGSGLSDANTYVGVYEADLWFANDPGTVDKWNVLTTGQKEWILRKASALVDQLVVWRGARTVVGQAMEWPRDGCTDSSGSVVRIVSIPGGQGASVEERTDVLVANDVVPDEIRQAVVETALNVAGSDRVRAAGETRWSQISVAGTVSLTAESDRSTTLEAKMLMPVHARRLVSRFGELLEPLGSVRTRRLSRG
jgi:hypothetical protein